MTEQSVIVANMSAKLVFPVVVACDFGHYYYILPPYRRKPWLTLTEPVLAAKPIPLPKCLFLVSYVL